MVRHSVQVALILCPEVPVILIARELGLDRVLPIAFYDLLRWYPQRSSPCLPVRVENLTHDDLKRFFVGKETFNRAVKKSMACLRSGADDDYNLFYCDLDRETENTTPSDSIEITPCQKELTHWIQGVVLAHVFSDFDFHWPPFDVLLTLRTMGHELGRGYGRHVDLKGESYLFRMNTGD